MEEAITARRFQVCAGKRRLREIERFSEFQTAGKAGLRSLIDGTAGKIKDFFVMRSQFVAHTGSSPLTTHNVAFTKPAIGLVIRRLPQPLYGTGAVAHYAEMGNFGMRVVMSYQPNTLAQQFTVDVLYGCAAPPIPLPSCTIRI